MEFGEIFFTIIVPFLVAVIVGTLAHFLAAARWRSKLKKVQAELDQDKGERRTLEAELNEYRSLADARGMILIKWQERFIEPLERVRRLLHLDTVIGIEPIEVKIRESEREIIHRIYKHHLSLSEAEVHTVPEVALNLGVLLFADGQLDQAITVFNSILVIDSTNQDVRLNLGYIKYLQKNYKEALKEFDSLIELSANRFETQYGKGLVQLKLENWHSAIESFTNAAQIRPEHTDCYMNLARAYAGEGQMDAALERADIAVKISPRSRKANLLIQELLTRAGRFEEAVETCSKYLKREEDAGGYYNLALAQAHKGDDEAALTSLREAIRLDDMHRFKAKDERGFNHLKERKRFQELLAGKTGLF